MSRTVSSRPVALVSSVVIAMAVLLVLAAGLSLGIGPASAADDPGAVMDHPLLVVAAASMDRLLDRAVDVLKANGRPATRDDLTALLKRSGVVVGMKSTEIAGEWFDSTKPVGLMFFYGPSSVPVKQEPAGADADTATPQGVWFCSRSNPADREIPELLRSAIEQQTGGGSPKTPATKCGGIPFRMMLHSRNWVVPSSIAELPPEDEKQDPDVRKRQLEQHELDKQQLAVLQRLFDEKRDDISFKLLPSFTGWTLTVKIDEANLAFVALQAEALLPGAAPPESRESDN
jgi:hypothetical protein